MNHAFDRVMMSRRLEEDMEELYENAPCGFLSTLPDGTIIRVNATFLEWTGYGKADLIGHKRFQELLPVTGRIFHDTHFGPLLLMQGYVRELAFDIMAADGTRMPILMNSVLKRDDAGEPLVIRTTLLDARGRRAYEEELRRAKQKAEKAETAVRQLADELEQRVAQRTQERDRVWKMSRDILAIATLDGRFLSCNPAFTTILGWNEDETARLSAADLVRPDHREQLADLIAVLRKGDPVDRFDVPMRHKDTSYRWLSMAVVPHDDAIYIVGRDTTSEREQAEILRRTEEALLQAQKMEAIGKLTGGVAHDFNNILQVIAGNLELLKLEFAGHAHAGNRLQQARFAVERGAKLASQLLSFASRQPLQPVPTHLGRILREMDDLLRRALGESVEIETIVSGGLWTASVDRNQLENVILNLAINARDAMRGAGRLTIEIGNASLDEHYASTHAGATPGQYVVLSISDTGSGMSPELIEHIFEPFFTTKSEGEGTGLGLSMVYGFVKQSGGHIRVDSTLGHGTTFRLYLPRVHQIEAKIVDTRMEPVTGGKETILVVEDDPAVQATTVDMLAGLGYKVLRAMDAQSALTILQSGVAVDLLFTDVVMPGALRSPELARQAGLIMPGIAVLFTSGYTRNTIVHDGRLDPGVELISKPYRRDDLARKIRHVLDSRRRGKPPVLAADAVAPLSPMPAARPDATPPSISASTSATTPLSVPAAARSLRILAVEDNGDSLEMLCQLLLALGHAARGEASADDALTALSQERFDVLLTDVGLPGKSGVELAREALAIHPSLRIIFCSGHGVVKEEGISALSLPKPYSLERMMDILSRVRGEAG